MRKSAFVVGRSTAGSTTVVVVSIVKTQCPILGPWTMRAVVSAN
jgi:hypothetical protein